MQFNSTQVQLNNKHIRDRDNVEIINVNVIYDIR